jgi:outer membrane biosynthesis protein TonB
MSRPFLAAVLAVLLVGTAGAADPAFDKALRDSLAAVHNSGADLYNQGKDFPGAYRMYEGALRTSQPLLAHRPETQKKIADGLAAAEKEKDVARKAFLLHQAIEAVRGDLKEPATGAVTPTPKKTVTPELEPKKTVIPEPKKTVTPEPEPKKTVTPEPKKTVTPEPKKTAVPEKLPTVKGVVTVKGEPVANADVTFTALDRLKVPPVTVRTAANGAYTLNLVAGRYAVSVAAGANAKAALPPRFATAATSGLTVVVPAGSSTFDFNLE